MLSSRHAFLVWLAVGALLVPTAYAALRPAIPAPAASIPNSIHASAGVATLPMQSRMPSVLSGASGIPSPAPVSGDPADSIASPVAAAQPAPIPASAEILAGWDALHYGTNAGISNGWVPPDVILSAGPTHVVEMVNLLMGVYTKTGTQVQVTGLATLFNSGGDFISDPKIQYDSGSDRWFATVTDVTATQVLLAVSTSSDPTGSWHLYTVPGSATGECLDQPILGVGTSTVIVSVNVFTQTSPSNCVSPYLGAEYWVINKSDLVALAAVPHMYDSGLDILEGSIHPVQIEGSSPNHFMVATYWPGTATTSSALHLFNVSGIPPGTVTVTVTSLTMPTAALPPSANQLGTRNNLDTADIRVSDAVWSAGKMWLGFDEACLADAARACIRLVQIDTTAGSILQDFDIDVAGKHVFYPGLRVDGSGNLAVVFGYSSSTDYPGVMVAGRLVGDAPDTIGLPQVVAAGTGPESPASCRGTCRYGDYFGAALDPTNGTTFWLAGEIGTSGGWSTHVFSAVLKAELSFSYFVVGGGTGYTPPVVSYVNGGVLTQLVLGPGSNSALADGGTRWTITTQLPGSSQAAGEIWALNTTSGPLASSGWANTSFSIPLAFVYFHQYAVSFDFRAVGGPGYTSPPQVTALEFATAHSFDLPSEAFLDANSAYSYPSLLAGSSATERWLIGSVPNGTVSGPLTLAPSYYHQVLVTFAFRVQGAAAPSSPQVRYASLGDAGIATANATVWADSPSAYSFDSALAGASASVRWGPDVNGNGTVTVAGTILVTYHRQFLVSVHSDPSALASAITGAGWYDAGASVTLSAVAPAGWRFDRWSGDASGTSATLTVSIGAPVNVTALFDAGLTITAGDGGSISYTYGSTTGIVPSGTSVTIYVPAGTTVSLTAAPASWSQAFTGWSGAASGSAASTTVQVSAPGTAVGTFGLNVLVVAGLSLVVLAAILVGVLVLLTRRRRRRPPA